jgi:hypothetical protein
MTEEKAIGFDLPDDEAFHEITVYAGDHPKWTGSITQLRIDPFEEGSGTVELEYLRVVVGSGSTGSSGGPEGPGGPNTNGVQPDGQVAEGSCACAVPGGRGEMPWALGAAAIAFAALGSRRARRATSRK